MPRLLHYDVPACCVLGRHLRELFTPYQLQRFQPSPSPFQMFDHLVKWIHEHHRLVGYHEMNRSTKVLRGTPFIIVSVWSVFLMGIQTLMHQYYGDDFTKHCMVDELMSPVSYVTLFSFVETIVLGIVHANYISEYSAASDESSADPFSPLSQSQAIQPSDACARRPS